MSRSVIRRDELLGATLHLGGTPIELADYATTGLRAVAVAPSGTGKTNAGLLIAEQLSAQGWVSILVDPESELASMYGAPVSDAAALRASLVSRRDPIVVVSARDANEFLPYGEAILEVADDKRQPLFVMLDEGQIFSSGKKRSNGLGDAGDLINRMAETGRKRALDLFITTHRFSGSIHRSLFSNKNLTFVGAQEDPSAWSALAPLCRAAKLDYADLAGLSPGEFYVFARRGVEKLRMPMAAALKRVAPKARTIKPTLPTNFAQWDRAMRGIPTPRLSALTPELVALLGAVAGLSSQQMQVGYRALSDEIGMRA
jgi:hypothetical protein